jgi:PAS domain S-box-containing protein
LGIPFNIGMRMANEDGTFLHTISDAHWRPARAHRAPKVIPWSEARIVLTYILLGCLWIIFSDRLLDVLNYDPVDSVNLQTYKGVNFIVTTGVLLYIVLRRSFDRWRRAEQKLREIEERFEYAGRAATDAIADWDFVTDTLWVSESFYTLFGYTRQEMDLTTLPWARHVQNVHPEDRERMTATARNAIDGGGKIFRNEYRYRRKDGSYAFVEGHGYVVRDETGQALRAIGCLTDVSERKLAAEKLDRSHRQLRALAARMESLREEERRRIAREIHDDLGQMLTGLKMDLRWTEKYLERESSKSLNPVLDKIVQASELIDATIASVQRIARDLRPGVLDDLGLAAALKHEAARWQDRTGITCLLSTPEPSPSPPPRVATTVFRIFQEALTNVARHAEATEVQVDLREEDGRIVLRVSDNGKGIRPADLEDPKSLGLLGMTERAGALGGQVAFQNQAPHGTTVTLRLPSAKATAPAAANAPSAS